MAAPGDDWAVPIMGKPRAEKPAAGGWAMPIMGKPRAEKPAPSAADREKLRIIYKEYQDRLLQVTAKNRSVLLRRTYRRHNLDLAELDGIRSGTSRRAADRAVGNIAATLDGRAGGGAKIGILLNSAEGDAADSARASLRYLKRNLEQAEEETGRQAGYLGFPFLQGRIRRDFYVRGPVALFPARLEHERKARGSGWSLRFLDRRPVLNGALVAALKKKGEYDIPDDCEESFDAMIEDAAGIGGGGGERFARMVGGWLGRIIDLGDGDPRGAPRLEDLDAGTIDGIGEEKLHLSNYRVVGNFPQADNEIHRDYARLAETGDCTGVVGELLGVECGGRERAGAGGWAGVDEADDADLNAVMDSDPSQDEVMLRSKGAGMLTVQGPPGTGKSQVIVNMVADALARGEKVLLVCQKRAALEVVQQRLGRAGLDRYAVFLEKETEDRARMYEQLLGMIDAEPPPRGDHGWMMRDASARINGYVARLVELGDALHARHFGGASAHALYSRADGSYEPALDLSGMGRLPGWDGLEGLLADVKDMEPGFKRFEDGSHPWHGRSGFADMGLIEKGRLRAAVRRLAGLAPSCILAGSPEDQSLLVGMLEGILEGRAGGERAAGRDTSSWEIERMIGIGEGPAGGERGGPAEDGAARAVILSDLLDAADGAGRRGPDADPRRAADALAEFVGLCRAEELAGSLAGLAPSCTLADGPEEQRRLGELLEEHMRGPHPGGPDPSSWDIERAIGIGERQAGGERGGPAAGGAARAVILSDLLDAADGAGRRDPDAGLPRIRDALVEFAGLCRAGELARSLAELAPSCILAGSPGEQRRLVGLLEEYLRDGSLVFTKAKKLAAGEIRNMAGIAPRDAGQAREALRKADGGARFWRMLGGLTESLGGLPEPLGEPAAAGLRRAAPGPDLEGRLSGIRESISAAKAGNGLSGWMKMLVAAGCAGGAPDAMRLIRARSDNPPLLASGGPRPRGALGRALLAMHDDMYVGRGGAPDAARPDPGRYARRLGGALTEYAGLLALSARIEDAAGSIPSCALAGSAEEQGRLAGLHLEPARGGGRFGGKEKRAGAIAALLKKGHSAPGTGPAEAARNGVAFWKELDSIARLAESAGCGGSEQGGGSPESVLRALAGSAGRRMSENGLSGWAKEAIGLASGRGGIAPAPAGRRAESLVRSHVSGPGLMELGGGEWADVAAGIRRAAARFAEDAAARNGNSVRFWEGYGRLAALAGLPARRIGGKGAGGARAALEDARGRIRRRLEGSPLSDWAKWLAGGRLAGTAARGARDLVRGYLESPGFVKAGPGDRRRAPGAAPGAGAGGRAARDMLAAPPLRPRISTVGEGRAEAVLDMFAALDARGSPVSGARVGAAMAELYAEDAARALSGRAGSGGGGGGGGGARLEGWAADLAGLAAGGQPAGGDARARIAGIIDRRAGSPGLLKADGRGEWAAVMPIVRGAAAAFASEHLEGVRAGAEFWEQFPVLLDSIGEPARGAIIGMASPRAGAGPVLQRGHVPRRPAVGTGPPRAGAGPLEPLLEGMSGTLGELDAMQEFDAKKREHEKTAMPLLRAAAGKFGPGDDWAGRIRQEFYAHWLDGIEREHPVLRGEPTRNYEKWRGELARTMERKHGLVAGHIRNLAGTSAARGRGSSGQWAGLRKELARKRKVKPVRRLFESYPGELLAVAPCWLASPESVSKVFPLREGLFDLVIVDEASQLAVERSVPFLYRGRRAVVAGDDKQLPPFDLFQVAEREDGRGEDGEDEAAQEKSLLDLSRTRSAPITLAWHYRSAHQDLIDFSNHAFYGGRLNVVPSTARAPRERPIEWVGCDGAQDEGTRGNRAEAEKVAELLADLWKERRREHRSVGIITFNSRQQDMISDTIDGRRESDAEFEELYASAHRDKKKDEGLFVKNIENVQGDERDVIIFSTGYARDAGGRLANRFGTLNQKGGEKRLNVAVTRAKEKMIVVSSIEPSDVKATSAHLGPRRFRQFLQYARAAGSGDEAGRREVLSGMNPGAPAAGRDLPREFDSPFEIRVFDRLVERGYEVDTQVGASGYRIDLAVVHPRDPGRYVLGIECDGASFHSARSVRERDVMRQKFLESRGWNIARIWSTDWRRSPEGELGRIDGLIRGNM